MNMRKITHLWRKTKRWVYVSISLSTVAFIFQACYGTPRDGRFDFLIEGVVKSSLTNEPIKGIKVSTINNCVDYTDSVGVFTLYVSRDSLYHLRFEDIDSTENDAYLPKDTVLNCSDYSGFIEVKLDAK
jgi:hypothetical protein